MYLVHETDDSVDAEDHLKEDANYHLHYLLNEYAQDAGLQKTLVA